MVSPRILRNPHARSVDVRSLTTDSRAFHASMPGYAPTPMVSLPAVAKSLGVRSVHIKDESARMGTPSFKILGASWATYRTMLEHLGLAPTAGLTLEQLRDRLSGEDLTLAAATDGNHGRAVAIMARLLGLSAHIFVPEDMVGERIVAIEGEGASVTVVSGGYDDAIRRSAQEASPTTLVVSDTSWEGYTEPPGWVIDGYSTLMNEVLEVIEAGEVPSPSLVVAQIGVGAFAAAVSRGFAGITGAQLLGVEPVDADCTLVSIEQGAVTTILGPQTSIMAGLNCGTPSEVAWNDVRGGFDLFATAADDHAREAMRMLAQDGVESGESGAAGLAGLLANRAELGLSADDTVFLFSTEGATDRGAYDRILAEGNLS